MNLEGTNPPREREPASFCTFGRTMRWEDAIVTRHASVMVARIVGTGSKMGAAVMMNDDVVRRFENSSNSRTGGERWW